MSNGGRSGGSKSQRRSGRGHHGTHLPGNMNNNQQQLNFFIAYNSIPILVFGKLSHCYLYMSELPITSAFTVIPYIL